MNTTTTAFQLPLPAGLPAPARHGLRLLQRLQHGTLHLELPDGSTLQLGQGSQPHASLRLHDWRVFGAVLRSATSAWPRAISISTGARRTWVTCCAC